MLGLAAGALALTWPAAAAQAAGSRLQGESSLMLVAGERVTVRLGPQGRLTLISIQPAAAETAAPPRPGRPKPPSEGNPLVETEAGAIAAVLGSRDGTAWLRIENGTSRAFDYRADLVTGATLQPTAVCTVLPLLSGYESWEKRAVPAILLSHFVSRDTSEVDCPQPARIAARPSTQASANAPATRGN
jgi:hypothetical protein